VQLTARLREIYKIILGANIGFLPFLMFYMVVEGKQDVGTSLILWGLTTWVVISEWWSLDETLEKYPSDSKLILALNVIYLCTLIFLPVSLLIGKNEEIDLFPYVMVFLVLSFLDVPLSLSYRKKLTETKERKEFLLYFIFDIILIGYYTIFIFAILPSGLPLFIKTLILAVFYLIEFITDHFAVPHITE
jgi:uncharacterized membrane protein